MSAADQAMNDVAGSRDTGAALVKLDSAGIMVKGSDDALFA